MTAAFARALYELADLLPILACWTSAVAYVALWNDRKKKKADMTCEEGVSGYKALAESIVNTGQLLPVIIGTLGITA
jgi:hypothetical protein